MKKIFSFIFINLFLINWAYSNELNNYSINVENEIKAGNENGMIGWQEAIAGGKSGPITIDISDTKIIIPDLVNRRIILFDRQFNFDRNIVESGKKLVHAASKIFYDAKNGFITAYIQGYGIKKIDIEGNEIYLTKYHTLPNQVQGPRNFFLLEDYIFFYNDKNEIQYIDQQGNIKTTTEAVEKLSELSIKTTQSENLSLSMGINQNDDSIIEELLNSKQYLLEGYNFYSTDINKTKKFFSEIKEAQITGKNSTVNKSVLINNKNLDINIDEYDYTLYGYDNEHNSYWGAGKQVDKDHRTLNIIIFDKFGNILDGFQYGEMYKYSPKTDVYPTSDSIVAITPNGDVYFMVGSSKKYTFYKVTRQW